MELEQVQIELERDAVERGVERYMSELEREDERGRALKHPVAERLLRQHVKALVPHMVELQAEAHTRLTQTVTSGRRAGGYEAEVLALRPEVLAYLAVKCALTAQHNTRVQRVTYLLGRMVNCEVWWAQARREESKRARDTGERNRIDMLRWTVKEIGPRTVSKWMKRLDDLEAQEWDMKTRIRVGSAILERALPHLTGLVEERTVRETRGKATHQVRYVNVTEEFTEQLRRAHGEVSLNRPLLMPMVIPPRPWSIEGGSMSGGYLMLAADGLKGARFDHTHVDGIPPRVLEAMNRVQETRWAINTSVLEVAREAFTYDLGPTPYEAPKPLPELLPDDQWEQATKEERNALKAARARIHDHNFKEIEKKRAQTRALGVAERFAEYGAIYFPQALDWRGRMYPIPQDLHPQGSDFVKALLRFADAKPLGKRGLEWLRCHVAACYGLDKEDRTTQALWTQLREAQLLELARVPWENLDFWESAEDPWQFLAAVQEYARAVLSGDPEGYASSLPVSIDGSCNGLQHLSAMGLDREGGRAVNLLPGDRQDIYQIVADRVNARLEADTNPMAEAWKGRVSRKTVKRGVMTTPYGVTKRGIADQLKKDGHARDLAEANYLRNHMAAAIDETILKGRDIMSWMQACVNRLSDENEGITWTTPIGLQVTQGYRQERQERIQTLMGRLMVNQKDTAGNIKRQKQFNSIAPNIIHSFDAAHMMLVVLSLEGVSFAMVHDSFGCHAADLDLMLEVTKETFVAIYQENWFESLKSDFTFNSRGLTQMPEPPQRGDLDITQVLDSEYFFA